MNKLHVFFRKRKYGVLLLSLLLMVVGDLLVPADHLATFRPLVLIQNVVVGFALFYHHKKWRNAISMFFILLLTSEVVQLISGQSMKLPLGFIYIIYFITLSVKVYQTIYRTKTVEREMIYAVICGFVMLCMIGSFSFYTVEVLHPDSFSNIGQGLLKYQNLQYFSFVTALTIGYGDIVPLTTGAKQLTLLFGLAGNFYMVIITGIVVGKYLNQRGA